MNRRLVAADVRRLKLLVQNEVRASSRRLLRFMVPMRVQILEVPSTHEPATGRAISP
jgi:hypothetical protein